MVAVIFIEYHAATAEPKKASSKSPAVVLGAGIFLRLDGLKRGQLLDYCGNRMPDHVNEGCYNYAADKAADPKPDYGDGALNNPRFGDL
jgi:hypothetical protein